MSETQRKLVEIIKNHSRNGSISTTELSLRSRISRLGVVSAMRSLEQQKLATSFRHGDDQWASLMWALNEENPMPTESLTDQLRLLEEEIDQLIKRPYGCTKLQGPCERLLAVAKGLEGRLSEVTSASTQQHLAAADRTSSELAALRADNEALNTFKLEAIKWLNALRCNAKVGRAGKSMADTALVALASLSK